MRHLIKLGAAFLFFLATLAALGWLTFSHNALWLPLGLLLWVLSEV